jgi:general stress protein 13
MEEFKIGDIIEGTVSGIETYGIFVKLDNDYNGLVHISEIDNSYIKNINDYVKINEKIYAEIIGIDKNNKHLNLSIKNMNYENNDIESVRGFLPLSKKLPDWIKKSSKKIKNE